MTRARLAFAGWPAGARRVAPELFRRRERQLDRQLDWLLPALSPRTVFMEIGSPDGELALRAAAYVERVWSVGAPAPAKRAPCNLRSSSLAGVAQSSVDVAFSERLVPPAEVWRRLGPGGAWFVYGKIVPARDLRAAGFSRVRYYGGGVRLPAALARFSRAPGTAAYK